MENLKHKIKIDAAVHAVKCRSAMTETVWNIIADGVYSKVRDQMHQQSFIKVISTVEKIV